MPRGGQTASLYTRRYARREGGAYRVFVSDHGIKRLVGYAESVEEAKAKREEWYADNLP